MRLLSSWGVSLWGGLPERGRDKKTLEEISWKKELKLFRIQDRHFSNHALEVKRNRRSGFELKSLKEKKE